MTDSVNVVMFPKAKKAHPPQNVEEMKAEIEEMRKSKAELTLDAVSMTVFETMADCGVDVNSPEYMKNIFWMLESIRALIYKKLEIDHEFHELVDKFYYTKESPEGAEISCIGQFEKLKMVD